MKLTKYSHACLVLEHDDSTLIVDPGNFTDDFIMPERVDAVVITHLHADHCDTDKLHAILNANPDAVVYGLAEIAENANVPVVAVQAGDVLTVAGFELEFTGGDHATIHPDIPSIGNLGVIINNLLYYPGDSFTPPPRSIRWIATPVSAPWMKLSETVEFLRKSNPEYAFPTHDAILSETGQTLVDRVITNLIDESISYERISSGKVVEL